MIKKNPAKNKPSVDLNRPYTARPEPTVDFLPEDDILFLNYTVILR